MSATLSLRVRRTARATGRMQTWWSKEIKPWQMLQRGRLPAA